MLNKSLKNAFAVAALTVGTSFGAQAAVIYSVVDTKVVGCDSAPHGLWTNDDINTEKCSNHFSIDGTLTLNNDSTDTNDWNIELKATAVNPQNNIANIDLTFTGYQDEWPFYKQEGGAPYNGATMDFFTDVLGTISIDGEAYDIDSMVGELVFQIGVGANAKDPNSFGGTSWIRSCGDSTPNGSCMLSDHWDLNFDLVAAKVPEPGSIGLLALGLAGIAGARRRTK